MSIFDKRINYKPFEYGHITDPLINAMWAGHWTVNEFTFSSDVQDFKTKLTSEQRDVAKRSILMTSQVEVTVKSYWSRIGSLFPIPEIADMGAVFGGIEVIHSRAYSEILKKLGLDDEFQNFLSEGVVKNRVNYLSKYADKVYEDDRKAKLYSLILFTLFTENVSLFSQFYILLAFNRFNNVFKDIANVVQYTSKEENLHAEGGMALISQARKESPQLFDDEFNDRVYEEVQEAISAETNIIEWILQGYADENINKELLVEYIKMRMNDSLVKIGFEEVFELNTDTRTKTMWMEEEVYASALTDFFYKRPIEYQKNMKSYDITEMF